MSERVLFTSEFHPKSTSSYCLYDNTQGAQQPQKLFATKVPAGWEQRGALLFGYFVLGKQKKVTRHQGETWNNKVSKNLKKEKWKNSPVGSITH